MQGFDEIDDLHSWEFTRVTETCWNKTYPSRQIPRSQLFQVQTNANQETMSLVPAYYESDKRMKEVMVKQEIVHNPNIKYTRNILPERSKKRWLQLFFASILS